MENIITRKILFRD